MTLRSECDTLASRIAQKAADKDTPLEQSVDALKALTGYFSAVQKAREPSEEEPEGFNFEAGLTAFAEEPQDGGKTELRAGHGRAKSSRATQ